MKVMQCSFVFTLFHIGGSLCVLAAVTDSYWTHDFMLRCYYSLTHWSLRFDNNIILSVFSNNTKGLSTSVETIEKESTASASLSATLIEFYGHNNIIVMIQNIILLFASHSYYKLTY